MALYADLLLPAATFLEQWGYDHSPPGSGFAEIKIKQPAVAPRAGSRAVGDILFEVAGKAGGSVSDAFSGIGTDTEGFARFRTESLVPWSEFTAKGVWVGPAYEYGKYAKVLKGASGKFVFDAGRLEEAARTAATPVYLGDEKDFPFVLTTYQPVLTMEGGSQNYPWAQEIFLAMHGLGWNSFVEINVEAARRLRINNLDEVWLESPSGRLKAKARVTEWIGPEVVAVARGQGHYAPGEWHKGMGINPNDIVGVDFDRLSGQSALFNTRVKVYRA
jgi:anaerobic selenocysteine-containing dehydrogenase